MVLRCFECLGGNRLSGGREEGGKYGGLRFLGCSTLVASRLCSKVPPGSHQGTADVQRFFR